MAENWHYSVDGQNFGPYSEADFIELIKNDTVKADTYVWSEDLADWTFVKDTELAQYLKTSKPKLAIRATAHNPVKCNICNNDFAPDELVEIDGRHVCSECKPTLLRQMQEGVADTGFYHYGGFWIRFVAAVIDGIILWLIQLPIGFVMGLIVGGVAGSMEGGGANALAVVIPIQILNFLISIVIPMTYSVFFVVKKGATPGKMAVGIRIINADGTEKISVGKAFGRYFAKWLSYLIFCIGFIMIAFDDQKRGLHDRICKTLVIYKNK
jgi:uncharacterized RDD family membrane protein YckC